MRASRDQSSMAKELDKQLLDVLKNGQTVVDDDGKPVKVTPSAALLNVIRARLKDIGVNSLQVPGNPADDLAKEAERRGLVVKGRKISRKMPPLSEDADAASA